MANDYLKQLLTRDEVVLIDTRQHWMAAIRFALKPILLIGGIILLLILNSVLPNDGILGALSTLIEVLLVIGAILAVIWLPVDLVRWRSRKYILTNRRVVRLEGVLQKNSHDSSLEKINDIQSQQSVFGRIFEYTDLTIYTASDMPNEDYDQLMDGLQFKKAVLDAKEAIRRGTPLTELAEGFVVKGGTNEASRRASGQSQAEPEAPASEPEPSPVIAAEPELTPVVPEPPAPEPEPEPPVEPEPEPPVADASADTPEPDKDSAS